MDELVERELKVPETADEVWRSLAEPEWLGEDATIDLREAGEVSAGDRTGFVEEADAPRRLVFWWSGQDEEATRVEIDLDETGHRNAHPRNRIATPRHPGRPRPRDRVRPDWAAARWRRPAARSRARCADGGAGARLMAAADPADAVFAALSDATRRALYENLGERGEATATDLARERPGQPAGRPEAPRHTRGRRSGGHSPRGPRGALPPHPGPDVRGAPLDGRGRRPVGRPARRPGAPARGAPSTRGARVLAALPHGWRALPSSSCSNPSNRCIASTRS